MINYFFLKSKDINYIFDLLNLTNEQNKLTPIVERPKVESILNFINTIIEEDTLSDVAQEHPTATDGTTTHPALLGGKPTATYDHCL